MKKRFISMLTILAMCLTLLPTAALAEETPEAGVNCICTVLCDGEHINASCPVCGAEDTDLRLCQGGELAPTDDGLQEDCICTVPCAEGQINTDCPVCSVENADLGLCQGEAPVDEQVQAVQAQINALPAAEDVQAMSIEEKGKVYEALQTAYDAYDDLNAGQQDQISGTEIFESLFVVFSSMTNLLATNGVDYVYYDYDEKTGTLMKKSETATNYTVLDSGSTTWGSVGTTTWYVVNQNIEFSDRINIDGNVHLILADGYTLTAKEGIKLESGNSLTIYGQAQGAGQLTAEASDVAIGGGGGLTVHGGTVSATAAGEKVTAIGGGLGGAGDSTPLGSDGNPGSNETLSSGTPGNGWVSVIGPLKANTTGFTGGVLVDNEKGAVYGDQALSEDHKVEPSKSMTIPTGASLTVPTGTKLTVNENGTLTNNGTLTVAGTLKGSGTLTGTGKFDGNGKYELKVKLNSVAVTNVTAPVAGAVPATTATPADSAWYTVDKVTWSVGNNTFTGGTFGHTTAYTVHVTLNAQTYAQFAETVSGQINDVTDGVKVTNDGDNTVTLSYTFPLTAPGENEGYSIDYEEETITITDNYEVNTAEDFSGTTVSSGTNVTPGATFYIRKAAADNTPASAAAELTIPNRPDAPTGLVGVGERSSGKITGLTAGTAYEILADTETIWVSKIADSKGEITALALGTYQVRLKATDKAFTGEPAKVEIKASSSSTSSGSSGGGGSSDTASQSSPPATTQEITQAVEKAKDGDTVQVKLPSSGTISKETFERIAGKDVTVEIATGTGVTWLVNGKDIPSNAKLQDLNLSVNTQATTIPVEVVNKITGVTEIRQLELAHTGEFGVTLTLRLDVGQANSGYWANLYYFNPQTQALEYQTAARIGADGNADIPFTHASSYAVVIDTVSHGHPFTDVPENAWYTEAALWAWREGLMVGTTKTTFSPDVATTRGMVVTILWRQAGAPVADYALDFTDVASDAYYAEAVRWAVSQGVAAGYGNGLFGPDDPITREQFAAILYRCAGSPAIPERVLDFIDAEQISPYAEDTLRWAVSEGLISGKGGGILEPQGQATRAQTAAMLMRYYQ